MFKAIKKRLWNYYADYRLPVREVTQELVEKTIESETKELAEMITAALPKKPKAAKKKPALFDLEIAYTTKLLLPSPSLKEFKADLATCSDTLLANNNKRSAKKFTAAIDQILKDGDKDLEAYLELRTKEEISTVYAKKSIPANKVLTLYAGTLVKGEGFPTSIPGWSIDATEKGNIAKYVKQTPSRTSVKINVKTEEFFYKDRPYVLLVTLRSIPKGEQLLYTRNP